MADLLHALGGSFAASLDVLLPDGSSTTVTVPVQMDGLQQQVVLRAVEAARGQRQPADTATSGTDGLPRYFTVTWGGSVVASGHFDVESDAPARNVDLARMRLFVLRMIEDDIQAAHGAGHGYSQIGLTDPSGRAAWTLLDRGNVRQDYDYRFLSRFSPRAIEDDLVRKAILVSTLDEAELRLLAAQWATCPGYDPAWALSPMNGVERARLLDMLLEDARREAPGSPT